jgi:hypothetical protein
MKPIYIVVILIVVLYLGSKFLKDTFYNLEVEKRAEDDLYYRPHVYTSEVTPALKNNDILTKSDFKDMFKDLIDTVYANGPPGGQNVTVQQAKHDLIFKDVFVNSIKRNTSKYPNPNKYSVTLNYPVKQIYKAELIEVYVPAATDDSVNIPVFGNRLYFRYTAGLKSTTGYIFIQAGTYLNPETIATELNRLVNNLLTGAGFAVSQQNKIGISVTYDRDLNRYIFADYNYTVSGTLIIYPKNGYVINMDLTVEDSITSYLMLDYIGPEIYPPYVSGPTVIKSNEFGLYVGIATNYGEYTDSTGNVQYIPTTADNVFSNSIVSNQVLTIDKLYLSLGDLNGTTCNIIADQNPDSISGNVGTVFCQVPNNTCVSSASVKTMLGQPNVYSAIQFYNPPVGPLLKLDIAWYTEDGSLVRILDHSFTVRVHYLQKRFAGTDSSFPIP